MLILICPVRFAIGGVHGELLSLLIRRRTSGKSFNSARMEETSLKDSAIEVVVDSVIVTS